MRVVLRVAVATLAAALAAGIGLTAARAGSTFNVCTSGCPYTSIQAAVTAASAGDTIEVGAGTYAESVTVGKSLTILGAQAGNDARSRTGSESTVSSFHVTSSNVVIDGFTLDNAGVQLNVDGTSGPTLSGVVARNDVFTGYASVGVPTYNAGNLL
ncbi:MAG TPA: hypothetical protein VHC01_14270, partial [Gaiellaceae bacterium]|nr:hypothetical protein [Gaiellaceae bacterium]